jgi:pyruvate formate-lyase activating enzyme-like uncharacterized protein
MTIRFTPELIGSCTGRPPAGCRYCDRGSKMVLYITGVCTEDCYYCPLSEEKKGKDVIFANERRLPNEDWEMGALSEARMMSALGTGITGGDPLVVAERTVQAIKSLKEAFGRKHHIHLYTSSAFSRGRLYELAAAGLDEIRFHPPIRTWSDFHRDSPEGEAGKFAELFSSAKELGLSAGIEVPAVPDEPSAFGLRAIVDHAIRNRMDFVNINELEASHTNAARFNDRGFTLVGDSMAVEGSRELAEDVIGSAVRAHPGSRTVLHFCSSVYKDAVQLRNRLKRTARNVKKPYELITQDGTLLRGVLVTSDPYSMALRLGEEYGIPPELMEASGSMVLLAPWVLEAISNDLEEECYISEVYPTSDGLEVERIPL